MCFYNVQGFQGRIFDFNLIVSLLSIFVLQAYKQSLYLDNVEKIPNSYFRIRMELFSRW